MFLVGSAGFFLTRKKSLTIQNAIILAFSITFYAWGEHILVMVMLGSSVLDYCCGLLIRWQRNRKTEINFNKRSSVEKFALFLSLLGNLGVLLFFKYADFFIENINGFLGSIGLNSNTALLQIALPLGISFYTFQSMSYTIDVYMGNVKPTRNLLNFLTYVTMFPQLVAGPIIRYKDVETQLKQRKLSANKFAYGVERFIIGLVKKVIVADMIAQPVDAIFSLPTDQVGFVAAWIAIIGYSFQIYFDFSGYSDMAIGLGKMLGFSFPENFNFPYIATTIKDFWRRWHISLSTWFRDYLYIPLGGSRSDKWKTYRNLFLVFLLCGFWHGASWNFIVWGLIHGAFLTLERTPVGKLIDSLPRPIRHLYTLLVVVYAFVVFRADTFDQAISISLASLGFNGLTGLHYTVPFSSLHVLIFFAAALFSAPLLRLPESVGKQEQELSTAATAVRSFSLAVLFIISLAIISATTHQPFIYFRF